MPKLLDILLLSWYHNEVENSRFRQVSPAFADVAQW